MLNPSQQKNKYTGSILDHFEKCVECEEHNKKELQFEPDNIKLSIHSKCKMANKNNDFKPSYHLATVDNNTQEWKNINAIITNGPIDISTINIQRCQHPENYKKFMAIREKDIDTKEDRYERPYMLHGTDNPYGIAANGFDRKKQTAGLLGKGVYLTPDICKCTSYSKIGNEGWIVVCSILPGNMLLLPPNSYMSGLISNVEIDDIIYDSTITSFNNIPQICIYDTNRVLVTHIVHIRYNNIENNNRLFKARPTRVTDVASFYGKSITNHKNYAAYRAILKFDADNDIIRSITNIPFSIDFSSTDKTCIINDLTSILDMCINETSYARGVERPYKLHNVICFDDKYIVINPLCCIIFLKIGTVL